MATSTIPKPLDNEINALLRVVPTSYPAQLQNVDFNTYISSNSRYVFNAANCANTPYSQGWGIVDTVFMSSAYAFQIAYPVTTGTDQRIHYRIMDNQSWGNWVSL